MINGKAISWEVKEGIGYVTLCNPPENKMDLHFFEELRELTNRIIPSSNFKAIIVTGQSRHFSSGANLEELLGSFQQPNTKEENQFEILHSNLAVFNFFDQLNVPVIAAIQGVCLGSGLELALHCHFRLCAENVTLGLPETTFNLMPGVGGTQKLMNLAGKEKTMQLVLKGSTFNAYDALDWNIIDAIYPKKDLMVAAIEFANSIGVDYRKYKKAQYLL